MLRFRNKKCISELNIDQNDRASQAVQHLTTFISVYLVIVDIYVYFTTGSTLPLPSLFYQALSESYVLFYIIALSFTGYILLKKWGFDVSYKPIFYCACYAMLSYLYWLLFIIAPLAIVLNDSNISKALRNALLIDTGILFLYIIKIRGIVTFVSDKVFPKKSVYSGLWFFGLIMLTHLVGVIFMFGFYSP